MILLVVVGFGRRFKSTVVINCQIVGFFRPVSAPSRSNSIRHAYSSHLISVIKWKTFNLLYNIVAEGQLFISGKVMHLNLL